MLLFILTDNKVKIGKKQIINTFIIETYLPEVFF